MSANNPPAFPRPLSNDETPNTGTYPGNRIEFSEAQDGMSLRDWFAGKALAGTMAGWSSYRDEFAPKTAASCYALADAMLAERAKVTP